ncbi:hypothetical protein FKM82_003153 [Ascaphus truei]
MAGSLVCLGPALVLLSVLFPFSASLPALESRFQRHADGLFTSELSKMKNDVAMRNYINSLLTSKRSNTEPRFVNSSEEGDHTFEEVCFIWLYQTFLNDSLSDNDALEATQRSSRSICPAVGHLIASLSEDTPLPKSLVRKK